MCAPAAPGRFSSYKLGIGRWPARVKGSGMGATRLAPKFRAKEDVFVKFDGNLLLPKSARNRRAGLGAGLSPVKIRMTRSAFVGIDVIDLEELTGLDLRG